jgi:NADH dehydrogenase
MRVLVLGAGYGGLRLALDLERGLWRGHWTGQVLLVDQYPLHQLVTEMHQVAAGSVLSDFVTVPLAKVLEGRRVAFRQAAVTGFVLADHKVLTSQGPLAYDCLVIGLGGEVDYFDSPQPLIPGLREHAVGIQTLQQANRVQVRLQEAVYRRAREGPDAAPLTIVVGGAGMTGVELAGQLADEAARWRREYRLGPGAIRVLLVEAQDRLLPGLHPRIAEYAAAVLAAKGVEIKLRAPIARVEKDRLLFASGETCAASLVVWAGGVRGPSLLADSDLPLDPKGRVRVNGYLQVEGFTDVYALGDCALVLHPHTGRPCAPSARLALNEAGWLAGYLMGRRRFPFVPHTTGVVISLGQGAAVAVVGRLRLFGRVASLLKSLISFRYLYSIGGLRLIFYQLRVGVLGKI